jgi:hypothetical protein
MSIKSIRNFPKGNAESPFMPKLDEMGAVIRQFPNVELTNNANMLVFRVDGKPLAFAPSGKYVDLFDKVFHKHCTLKPSDHRAKW